MTCFKINAYVAFLCLYLFSVLTSHFWIRNCRSHIATHLIVLVGATVSSFVVSNQIGMKSGRNVLQVNTHRLTESDFRFDVTLFNVTFEMAAMTSFHTEKRYHLVRAYAKLQRPPHMQTSWLAILSTVSGLQYDVHTYLFLFGILGVDLSLCSGLLAIVRCINWCCIDFYCVSLC